MIAAVLFYMNICSFGNRYFFTYMQWSFEKQNQKRILVCSGQISQIWNEEEVVGEEERDIK